MARYGMVANTNTPTSRQHLANLMEEAAVVAEDCGFWFDGYPAKAAFEQFAAFLGEGKTEESDPRENEVE